MCGPDGVCVAKHVFCVLMRWFLFLLFIYIPPKSILGHNAIDTTYQHTEAQKREGDSSAYVLGWNRGWESGSMLQFGSVCTTDYECQGRLDMNANDAALNCRLGDDADSWFSRFWARGWHDGYMDQLDPIDETESSGFVKGTMEYAQMVLGIVNGDSAQHWVRGYNIGLQWFNQRYDEFDDLELDNCSSPYSNGWIIGYNQGWRKSHGTNTAEYPNPSEIEKTITPIQRANGWSSGFWLGWAKGWSNGYDRDVTSTCPSSDYVCESNLDPNALDLSWTICDASFELHFAGPYNASRHRLSNEALVSALSSTLAIDYSLQVTIEAITPIDESESFRVNYVVGGYYDRAEDANDDLDLSMGFRSIQNPQRLLNAIDDFETGPLLSRIEQACQSPSPVSPKGLARGSARGPLDRGPLEPVAWGGDVVRFASA